MKSLVLICVLLLTACNTSTKGNQNIRPSEKGSEAATANLNLAIEYMRLGEYQLALDKLERAKLTDPDFYATYNAYGLLYQQLGDNEQAEDNFKKALSLNSNDSNTLNNYGRYLCQRGRTKKAEEVFLQAAKNPLYLTPDVALTNAGTCLLINKEVAPAEKYFRRALDLNPSLGIALISMSRIAFQQENYLSARAYIQRYFSVSQHTAESLLLAIKIEQKLGYSDAASSYALSLRNGFPDSEQYKAVEAMGIR